MHFVLNCNVLALLSFYALPSGGNRKMWWSIDCRPKWRVKVEIEGQTEGVCLRQVWTFQTQVDNIKEEKQIRNHGQNIF